MYYFALVGSEDRALYETELGTGRAGDSGSGGGAGGSAGAAGHAPPTIRELTSSIVHASLDVVDEVQWASPALYLKSVDKFYNYAISAFVTPGNVRLLLLHESRNEEAIRQFFFDAWDAYVKALLSPFYKPGQPITNVHFDAKIKQIARKYL